MDHGSEIFQVPNDQAEFALLGELAREVARLGLDGRNALLEASGPRFEIVPVNNTTLA